MSDDEESWDDDWNDDTVIDADLWVHALLAMTGDKEYKEKLIRNISEKTGQAPEEVELIIVETIKYLSGKTRSN